MAQALTNAVMGNAVIPRIYSVSWKPNGAGAAPASSKIRGNIATIARTGAGTWVVTFIAGIIKEANVTVRHSELRNDVASLFRANCGPSQDNADGTWQQTVFTEQTDTGAAVDIAANASREIMLTVIVEEGLLS